MFRAATGGPDLEQAPGHWLRPELIAWPGGSLPPGEDPAALDWRLHWSADQRIELSASEPLPWPNVSLQVDPAGLPAEITEQYPHLGGQVALRLPDEAVEQAREILRCQLVLTAQLPSGQVIQAGQLQLPGVIDSLYHQAVDAELGASWSDGRPTLRLWAPTARSVALLRWIGDAAEPLRTPMVPAEDGTWEISGEPTWIGSRYRYEVRVYTPYHARVVVNQVTDPYSVALTINSTHSVLVDLGAAELVPEGWLQARPLPLAHRVDQVIYELHLRDFSITDATVPEPLRGSYLAPTVDSAGMRHLSRLVEAGLNTVQLLPLFDNATVEEHPEYRIRTQWDELRELPPDSSEQQRQIAAAAERSGFNWGYDPWHYFAPEGSFSSTLESAEGPGRVLEFRQMVGAFHQLGLRVVLDQVFNHTASSGQGDKSVLDRIVPGYYHRLDCLGVVATSTCCPNVATEHLMAQKLMVDACLHWVRHYRVDGFRFDLMGHHSRANMLAVRAALDGLNLAEHGVDGAAVTLYGEGWNFGEVADNARFVQATQGQLEGTGIATFTDRLRDAARGGAVWDGDPRHQGFGSGLLSADNGSGVNGDLAAQEGRLGWYTDLIQLGLAGNLSTFRFESNSRHHLISGADLDYGGRPAGYASEPDEVITYVDAHDNETLFDALTLKLHPATPMWARVRMNTVCLALSTLAQTPVLWHAGSDMLRSKSLDRNSYNSGDWFNFLDFTLTDNGFAAGLPPERDNAGQWHVAAPLLANPRLKPRAADLRFAHEQALDLLRLRTSTRLFRLGSADQIRRRLTYPVSGTWLQQAGVIVLRVQDPEGEFDQHWAELLVVFNATPWLVRQGLPFDVSGHRLHPVQAGGSDDVVQESRLGSDWLTVPQRTVAVFVKDR